MKLAAAVVAILCLWSAGSTAGETNLGWHGTGPHGLMDEEFSCDTNEGSRSLVGSFVAPAGIDSLISLTAYVDFCIGGPPLPSWWLLNGCRAGALSASIDFEDQEDFFNDYWQGRGTPSVTFETLYEGMTGRITVTVSLPADEAGPLAEGEQYYAFRILIDNRNTTGEGACAGCLIPACIVLNGIRLDTPTNQVFLYGPDFTNSVTWQGGLFGCPFIVPVVPTTWSSVKALYR